MYDNPPEFDYKLSELASHCQTRLHVYKQIFDFMESNRTQEESSEEIVAAKKEKYLDKLLQILELN